MNVPEDAGVASNRPSVLVERVCVFHPAMRLIRVHPKKVVGHAARLSDLRSQKS
jgi:hypothetical protein